MNSFFAVNSVVLTGFLAAVVGCSGARASAPSQATRSSPHAALTNDQTVQAGGDTGNISGLVDSSGAVSFNIDVNGDAGGSTHNGTITCPRPVQIVSEKHNDGGGHYEGAVNGNIYTWHTQCGNFAGVHYTIQLKY